MIVLDTTILVYAVGDDHPLRAPCRDIIRAVIDGQLEARTTIEVIQEFAHVRARRRGRNDASALAQEYAGLLQPLIVVDELDLKRGIEVFRNVERVGSFDAILAATTIRRGALGLVSTDEAFGDVDNLRHLHPLHDLDTIIPS